MVINQQNRKDHREPQPVADKADHMNYQAEYMFEYTEPWWDDSYRGFLCAVSDANPKKKRKMQDEIEETTPDHVSPTEGKKQGQRQGEDLLHLQ